MSTDWQKWAPWVLVGGGAALGLYQRSRRTIVPYMPKPGDGWVDADAPRRIRELAAPIAAAANWPDLPDFLVAVAWTESRGNPRAGSDVGNAARGWFGLRPDSSRHDDLGLPVSALKDERWAVLLAAWYAHRLQPYAFPGQKIDWLALRRGWALPKLVSDVNETAPVKNYAPGERSADVRERLSNALEAVGLPQSFMYRPAFPPGYQWPGIGAMA